MPRQEGVPVDPRSRRDARAQMAGVAAGLWFALAAGGGILHASGARASELHAEAVFGFDGGPAADGALTVDRIARETPLALRAGLTYASRPPGSAGEARRIFINDADNGTPEKDAHAWTARLDFVLPAGRPGAGGAPARWRVFAGPRYCRYTAHFVYVGGNEDFDVRSGQWGLGGGIEGGFVMTERASLLLRGGVDYFFEAPLDGHDTAYSPDGEHVNPRKDYGWRDADDAIEQPEVEVRLLAGVAWRLGR